MSLSLQPYISKSKFLSGLQCRKLLWFYYNSKQEIPEPDESTQAIFDQGHEVGALAKRLFPAGIEVGAGIFDLPETIRLTADAVKLRKPMFEAAFSANDCYARVDILNPVTGGAWDIIEVKSSTSPKDVNLSDIAFQAWVLTNAGLKIRRCFLCHVNNKFVRHGEIDPKKFFTQEDVTTQVVELKRHVAEQVGEMFKAIRLKQAPEIEIGPHCTKPYTCPLHERCWSFLPEYSVFTLRNARGKDFKLLQRGIQHLAKIPDDFKLTDKQEIQRSTLRAGKPHVDHAAITDFLERLQYPLHFLDFETFATAIPFFDGQRPFRPVPFQFSLHLVRAQDARPEHRMFLAEGGNDPRMEFMHQLRSAVESKGSVVVFNATFELGRLKDCAEFQPEHAVWVEQLKKRVVDLAVPFSKFHYYHPAQGKSASMKAVLPALTGKGYEELDIQKGDAASREFLRVTFGDVSEAEGAKVRKQLEDYCGLDTEGMVEIVKVLRTL